MEVSLGRHQQIRGVLRLQRVIRPEHGLSLHQQTADIYELIVERHRTAATVATSNRESIECLGHMDDALLAQSAIERLQSAAHELGSDGESDRKDNDPHQHRPPSPTITDSTMITTPTLTATKWSHPASAQVVPSDWRATFLPHRDEGPCPGVVCSTMLSSSGPPARRAHDQAEMVVCGGEG